MSKLVLKSKAGPKIKGRDKGVITSVIPTLIMFLRAIGYANVTDVHIVMTYPGDDDRYVFGKHGRIIES